MYLPSSSTGITSSRICLIERAPHEPLTPAATKRSVSESRVGVESAPGRVSERSCAGASKCESNENHQLTWVSESCQNWNFDDFCASPPDRYAWARHEKTRTRRTNSRRGCAS